MPIQTAAAREVEQLQLVARARHLTATGEARTIRETRKMSLSEVARACGVAVSTVMRWENGERQPRGEAGARYASVLSLLARPL